MADIGRISGPLLKDNLLRNGVDLSFETDLLYLNVNDDRIGLKTESPSRELEIVTHGQTIDLIVDNEIDAGDLVVTSNNSEIKSPFAPLYINAGQQISANALKVDNLKFNNNKVEATVLNTHFNLTATNRILFNSNVLVNGSLHATGNVTFDGSIVFGDSDLDSVTLNADIASNIIPDQDLFYNLGSSSKQWKNLYSKTVSGATIVANAVNTPDNINFKLKFSNAWFVASNGSDVNQGDHLNAPFATVAHALSIAEAGDTVYIFPGTYTEGFPLVVPTGVTVVGFDVRQTMIQPTSATNRNDAFLLNGETTVSDLTVKNFYYDSVANTGYAFRLANNFKVTTRSPYIQNVTVITRGSNITAEDPYGFYSLDAGCGVLLDGSVANSDSKEATLLFHSCTFITPGANCVTMTNGVRVEWLNSFTYFAVRGLYATQGTLGFASLGTKFGAEVRSIASANVYGTYGAVADGASTLMYLINHNFGYIGSNADTSNDATLVVQTNEAVELNSGKIYFTSQSQNGDFRIGDNFLVDFGKGTVSFDTSGIAANGASSLTFIGDNSKLYITAGQIELGDFRLSGNTIQTLTRPLNVSSANGVITFTQNVSASKNINIVGNFQTEGTINFGNQTQDTITFNNQLSQNLNPKTDLTIDIGTSAKIWRDVYTTGFVTPDIQISGNTIQTTAADSNLMLFGNGTGLTKVETLLFGDNSISATITNNPIILTPNTGRSLSISGSNAVKIPRTNTALTTAGELRFNTSTQLYDGYSSALVGLGGVYSADRKTSLLAHETNNTINFKINNVVTSTFSTAGLVTNALYSQNLEINANTLLATNNSTISLVGDSIIVQGLTFKDNTISSAQNVNLGTTGGDSYVHIAGNGAMQIPAGDNIDRPLAPEIGNTRYNTEMEYMETWNGTAWVPVTGTGEVATFEYANEQTTFWSIVLG